MQLTKAETQYDLGKRIHKPFVIAGDYGDIKLTDHEMQEIRKVVIELLESRAERFKDDKGYNEE